MSPLKRSATGDDSIAVAITVMATLIMATAINHTATTDPTYYGYGYYRPLSLLMVMAMAGATRLAARSP
jgi:hypothetical protein